MNTLSRLNKLTEQIIGAAIEVHRHLGPGLLESAYETCMAYELQQLGLAVERQKNLPLIYKDIHLNQGYRIDMLVEHKQFEKAREVYGMALIVDADSEEVQGKINLLE